MIETLFDLFPALNSRANIIVMIGVGFGMMLFVYGAFDALTPSNPASRRYRRAGLGDRQNSAFGGAANHHRVGGDWVLWPHDLAAQSCDGSENRN